MSPCPGDCDQNGTVTIDEMLRGVRAALNDTQANSCPSLDGDASGSVSVSELMGALRGLMRGCGPGEPRPRRPEALINHEVWEIADASTDPFRAMRPEGVVCEDGSFHPEISFGEQAVEVDTAVCPYITLGQPTRAAVNRGEILYLRMWHYDLTAPSGGSARIAIALPDCLLLDERRNIPSPSRITVERLPAPFSIPAGTPVYFHVDNHGANTYDLVEISVGGSLLELKE